MTTLRNLRVQRAILAVVTLAALASPAAAQPTESLSPCTVALDVDNRLGNFEIQDLLMEEEGISGSQRLPVTPFTVSARVAPHARGQTQFTLKTGCATGRRLKATPRKDSGDAHLDYLIITLENCVRSTKAASGGQCKASMVVKR